MKIYTVEFHALVQVSAENEEEAISHATSVLRAAGPLNMLYPCACEERTYVYPAPYEKEAPIPPEIKPPPVEEKVPF